MRARPFRGVPADCRWPSRLQPQPVGSGTMCPPGSMQEKTSGYAGGSLFCSRLIRLPSLGQRTQCLRDGRFFVFIDQRRMGRPDDEPCCMRCMQAYRVLTCMGAGVCQHTRRARFPLLLVWVPHMQKPRPARVPAPASYCSSGMVSMRSSRPCLFITCVFW